MGWVMSDTKSSGYASLTRSTAFRLYRPQADRWWLFDNAAAGAAERLIASGASDAAERILKTDVWDNLVDTHR